MNLSTRGIALLEELEGRYHKLYMDSGGEPTIGIGHLITRPERRSGNIMIGGVAVNYRDTLTDAQIEALLRQDVAVAEKIIADTITADLNQNQYDALVCFVLNTGTTGNKLRRAINSHAPEEVILAAWREWKHDNGHVVQGLINRREKEIALWKVTN